MEVGLKTIKPCPRCWRRPDVGKHGAGRTGCAERVPVSVVAERHGIAPGTMRSYIARHQAPAPDWQRERGPDGLNRSLYRPETIAGWERPGPRMGGRPPADEAERECPKCGLSVGFNRKTNRLRGHRHRDGDGHLVRCTGQ